MHMTVDIHIGSDTVLRAAHFPSVDGEAAMRLMSVSLDAIEPTWRTRPMIRLASSARNSCRWHRCNWPMMGDS